VTPQRSRAAPHCRREGVGLKAMSTAPCEVHEPRVGGRAGKGGVEDPVEAGQGAVQVSHREARVQLVLKAGDTEGVEFMVVNDVMQLPQVGPQSGAQEKI